MYSDRYFRYGLPLRVAPRAGPRVGHAMPLAEPAPRLAPGAGLLLLPPCAATRPPSPARCMTLRRAARVRSPAMLSECAETPFSVALPEKRRARRRALDYRQPRGGVEPQRPPAAWPRPPLARPRCASAAETARRPQFALADDATTLRTRKVLGTERYYAAVRCRRGLQRATVRAMLACSALLYTLAFVTFYFLSLP